MQAYRAAKACKKELRDALQRQGGERSERGVQVHFAVYPGGAVG